MPLNTWPGVVHKVSIGGMEVYWLIAEEAGKPVGVRAKVGKHGGTLGGLLDAWCHAVSISLRAGTPIAKLVERYGGCRFEPHGQTSNPAIPHCESVTDYLMRYLAYTYGSAT